MRKLLAAEFAIWTKPLGSVTEADAMVFNKDVRATLINYLLLYDQIIIPTQNFLVVPVLRLVLGEEAFDYLLSSKVIVLARVAHSFGYAGGGSGLIFYTVGAGPKSATGINLAYLSYLQVDKAIDQVLEVTLPVSTADRKKQLAKILNDNVVQVSTEKLGNEVISETYADIRSSATFKEYFGLRNKGRPLSDLLGIKKDQVRMYAPEIQNDEAPEIDSVLRVAFQNWILGIAGACDALEITGGPLSQDVLNSKVKRYNLLGKGDQAFTEMQSISGVPDIGKGFAMDEISIQQIIKLRESKEAVQFRKWLERAPVGETVNETLERFVASLGPSLVDKLPLKILRFFVTTGAGLLLPIAGGTVGGPAGALAGRAASTSLSAVNTFLFSKWFPRQSPKLFLQQLKVEHQKASQTKAPLVPPPSRKRSR
ncbi:hypothetical protein [Asticcacaulis taihuensis]|uniref:hypothetical protein n=1 Tax=Asticcacaulis taihuensis TaxID=260084 RepID=UPI003F7C177C